MVKRLLVALVVALALTVSPAAPRAGDFGDMMCDMCYKSSGNATGACALCVVIRYFESTR